MFPLETDALGVLITRELDEIQRENSEIECCNLEDKLISHPGISDPIIMIKLDPVNAEAARDEFVNGTL